MGTSESSGMTQPSVMGRPRDSSRDLAILDATLALLTEVGYEQLSMEAVAGRSGAAKTTIYRRYRDKAELVEALAERGSEILAERLLPAIKAGTPALASVRDALKFHVTQKLIWSKSCA